MRWLFTSILSLCLCLCLVHAAHECSSTCGTPSGLSFCSHVSFAVCGGDAPWEDTDASALSAFSTWSNASTTPLQLLPQYANFDTPQLEQLIAMLDLTNTNSKCGSFLQHLECAVHFPVCEIGREYSRLCTNSCVESTKKQCPGLTSLCSLFPSNELESNGKCFKLSYKGPAVGMWVAGFTISLVFSILNCIGINLQKLSMTRNELADVKKSTFQQPLWMIGLALVGMGSLLDFVAFGMAPQTLLAPLAALTLVWNMIIAPIFHHEKVTRNNIIATAIIFTGVTITVIFAGHNTPDYELADLIRLYNHTAMYFYMIFVASFLIGLHQFAHYIERTHRFEGGFYHIVCYGGMAGTFGGQSVLLAKSTVELIKSAIWGQGGAGLLKHFAPYLLVGGLAGCLFLQVRFLNSGLARFDALAMIPVYQSFWILMSVLGGIIYFEEYVSMTRTKMFMFTVGGVITILGIVYLLKTRRRGNAGEDDEEGPYIQLQGLTPNSAWVADDLDEEEVVQIKLSNKARDHVIDLTTHSAVVTPSTTPPSSLQGVRSAPARPTAAAVASAVYHIASSPKSSSRARQSSKDDDDFL